MFDIIGKRRWFYLVSLILTIPGLFFILLTPFTDAGLQFSIDYTGGTKWEIRFEDPRHARPGRGGLPGQQGLDATAVTTGSGFIEIKTEPIGLVEAPAATPVADRSPRAPAASGRRAASASQRQVGPSASPPAAVAGPVAPARVRVARAPRRRPARRRRRPPRPSATPNCRPTGKLGEVRRALEAELGPIDGQNSLTTIGPVVSSDLVSQALMLILVGSLGILLWITFRFRDVKFGVTALVALLHDVILVVGVFAILGTFFGVEIDALFVTAMLTVIGFSVHDTIVVFDRVRENKARHAGEPFADIVNHSILQTFGRSITTSLTVVLTLLALLLFGGSAINEFVLTLLIGIISGTYSSIFVASLLLVDWQLWEDRRRGRVAGDPGAPRPTVGFLTASAHVPV